MKPTRMIEHSIERRRFEKITQGDARPALLLLGIVLCWAALMLTLVHFLV